MTPYQEKYGGAWPHGVWLIYPVPGGCRGVYVPICPCCYAPKTQGCDAGCGMAAAIAEQHAAAP